MNQAVTDSPERILVVANNLLLHTVLLGVCPLGAFYLSQFGYLDCELVGYIACSGGAAMEKEIQGVFTSQ